MAFTAAFRTLVCAGALGLTAFTASAAEAAQRLGAPYEAGGVWFVPAADPSYDEQGLAGVYGEGMRGQLTRSGERFDPAAMAAAHATLPLPGVVEVTNLSTGKVLTLRINDRGPYVPGRILSLTPAAARALGVAPGEAARVRVRYATAPRQEARRAPPASSAGFGVQVGAFSDRARAEHVAREVASAGAAHVDALQRGGATLYRVTLGPLADPRAAESARGHLESLGYVRRADRPRFLRRPSTALVSRSEAGDGGMWPRAFSSPSKAERAWASPPSFAFWATVSPPPAARWSPPGNRAAPPAPRPCATWWSAARWTAGHPRAELLIFYAARADHLERTVRPALARDAIVLSDRFSDSSRAYQGAGGGVDPALLQAIEVGVVGDDKPDLTLILDLPVEQGLARAATRGGDDRFEAKGLAFHERLRGAFLSLAADEPARCVVIDAAQPVTIIAEQIWAQVAERLAAKAAS